MYVCGWHAYIGLYILKPEIFDFLDEKISANVRDHTGFAFTPALEKMRKEQKTIGFVIEGERFDIGDPGACAVVDLIAMRRCHMGDGLC